MTVTVQPGSGNRTVTKLELRLSSGGIWDTVYGGFWVLGTAGSLDGPLYNGSNSDVNFAVTDGTSFKLFAGDNANGSYLPVGATATLTANFADGTTATASAVVSSSPPPPPPPSGPTLSMTFEGKLRDRVGQGESLSSDGAMDGTMTVTVQPGSGNRTVTKLELRLSSGGIWDTVYGSYWVLGTAGSLDGPLLNASNSTVNFAVTDGTSFKLFAGDTVSGTYLPVGATATLTANFADGTAATASAVIASSPPPPPPPSGPTLSMTYDGKLRDRVGQGDLLMSDGAMDGTMTVVVQPGSGDRTVTKLELRLSSGGLWDTLSSTIYWVLGAAGSLDGTLYNASSGAVNFAVTDGTNFKLFAGDIIGGTYLPTGATATLTANFADGTSATASAVIP
jgi:hypothetical protein